MARPTKYIIKLNDEERDSLKKTIQNKKISAKTRQVMRKSDRSLLLNDADPSIVPVDVGQLKGGYVRSPITINGNQYCNRIIAKL